MQKSSALKVREPEDKEQIKEESFIWRPRIITFSLTTIILRCRPRRQRRGPGRQSMFCLNLQRMRLARALLA